MTTSVHDLERALIDAGDPAYVTPLGDRRERPVPCALCARPTLAIRGPLCPRHEISEVAPAASSDGGGDRAQDPRPATTPTNRNATAAGTSGSVA